MKISELVQETPGADGKWFDYTFADGKTQSCLIASAGQDGFQNFTAQRFNAARRGRTEIPEPVARRIVVDGIVKFLLKDWKGDALTEDDGSPAAFTEKNVRGAIDGAHLESKAFRAWIMETAGQKDNFVVNVGDNGTGEAKESASSADILKRGAEVAPRVGAEGPTPS